MLLISGAGTDLTNFNLSDDDKLIIEQEHFFVSVL